MKINVFEVDCHHYVWNQIAQLFSSISVFKSLVYTLYLLW